MRFQNQNSPPPYLNRRDQYRMLGMLLVLMFVVVAIDFTARPKNWEWFFALDEVPQEEQELRELDLDDLDFRIREEETAPLAPETFIAEGPPPEPEELDLEETDFSRIPPELLESVEDQRLGLLRSEEAALKAILEQVRAAPEQELRRSANRDVGFRVAFTESDKHRGELLEIEGNLWRFARFPFGQRNNREDDLYQAWIFTPDSGTNPWFVLLGEKPEGLEAGDRLDRPVRVAGYFFKRYGYATESGPHVAPMLVAKTLHLGPAVAADRARGRTENLSYYVVGFLGFVALIFGGIVWWFAMSDRKFRKSHLAEIAESRRDAPPEVVENLNNLEATDPAETFRRMEREQL